MPCARARAADSLARSGTPPSSLSSISRLHVHVLIDSLTWGGAETLLADFATAMEARGGSLSVAYLDPRGQSAGRLRERGVEPKLVPVGGLLSRSSLIAVREHLRSQNADLLHTHLSYSDFLGGRAARSLGLPAVCTLHVMEWGGSPRERLKDRLTAAARRRSHAQVIAVSEVARHAYLKHGWDRPGRVVTVHNGISGTPEPGAGAAIRAELGIGRDELVVAMLSVLRTGKGHALAARAVASLRERFPQLRLLVLGDGPDREAVLESMRPAGDALVAAGFREDVMAVLDGVDALVHPSRVDALPTALIEAMAASVPVVATDVGGIPEIVADGETGLLVASSPAPGVLADTLAQLLGDSGLRARMGGAARRSFEGRFSLDAWMERLIPVYETALGRPVEPEESSSGRCV